MGKYQIPRNVKGESRILFIFSRKSLICTAGFALVIGGPFYLLFNFLGLWVVGMSFLGVFALIRLCSRNV